MYKRQGTIYLSTDNLMKILLNPISVILILVSIIILAFYIFFEFTSIIICFDESNKYNKIGLFKLFKISLEKSKKIFYPKNFLLIIFVLLMIPLTNIILTSSFIGKLKIPEYILDVIISNNILNRIYIVAILVLYVLVIRWIFSIHEITLKTENFKNARKNSTNLTKHKTIKIFIYSIGLFLVLAAIGVLIYYLGIIIIGLWTKYISDANYNNIKEIFIGRAIGFRDFTLFISTIVSFIIGIGFISTLYYEYTGTSTIQYSKVIHKRRMSISFFKIIFIIVVIYIESISFSTHSNNIYNLEFFYNTTAISHRIGGLFAPENTISAFEEAFLSKAEYAELDVQQTKDGELIIIHDSNFKRTTGVDKNIWDVNYNEVKKYDAGKYYNYSFKGQKIPTLEEVIKYSKDKIKLLIEIKVHGHEKYDIEQQVIDLVKKYNIENQCIIASMNKKVLQNVKQIDPNIVTCYLTAVAYGDFYNWNYVDIYGIESTFVNQKIVDKIHSKNKKIFVWTINDEKLMKKMIELGVDSIITDNPFLVEYSVYSKQNAFIKIVANKLFE